MSGFEDDGDTETAGGGGGFSAARIVSAVRRRWRIIAAATVAVTTLAAGIVLLMPNRYDATAVIQIDPRKKTVTQIEGVTTDLGNDTATIESETEIVGSRTIALKVIETLGLRDDAELAAPSLWQRLRRLAGFAMPPRRALDETGSEPRRDELAHAFADRLKVMRVRNTLLIEARFSSQDPVKAARIANAIAEAYIADQLATKSESTRHATRLIEERLDALRKQVASAEGKVQRYKAEHGMYAAEGQLLSEKELARLMEQTVIARNKSAEARARLEQVKSLTAEGGDFAVIADVLESHTVRLMKEKLAEVSRRRAEFGTRYGPLHPEMAKVNAELADARRQLESEIGKLVQNVENEHRQAAAREAELISDLEARKVQETITKAAGIDLNDLQREAEATRQLYEGLLTRYKQTAETQGLQLADARIVERADTPLFPAAPKRKQLVLMALAAGLAFGLALALLLEFATAGIGLPDEAEGVLDLAHLSSLPAIATSDADSSDPLFHHRLMVAAPGSAFAEAIRQVRREIEVRRRHQGSRVLLVAASLPGEGASLVASNLAHHLALTGEQVLLIDADLRRGNLTRQLAPERRAGLAEALSGEAEPEAVILRDQLTGLHFLPAHGGAAAGLPSPELVSSPAMADLLDRLAQQFTTIVLDAPPLLPVIDTRALADLADEILFVMAWRRTPKPLAKRAVKTLAPNRDKIVGVIVNRVDPDVLADIQGFEETAPAPAVPRRRQAA